MRKLGTAISESIIHHYGTLPDLTASQAVYFVFFATKRLAQRPGDILVASMRCAINCLLVLSATAFQVRGQEAWRTDWVAFLDAVQKRDLRRAWRKCNPC
jgi:hypothetical protein